MEPGKVNAQVVALLSDLAGFHFNPERCEKLAPQLDWMLKEAARLDISVRDGLEPANMFFPLAWQTQPKKR